MINFFPPGGFQYLDIWYALPLVVAVSLVYAGTRHEEPMSIMVQSLRTGVWIVSFMAVVFGILMAVAWWL